MLTSITPLGERGRNARWGATVTWYVLGSVLAGLLTGAVLGAVVGRGAGLAGQLTGFHPGSGLAVALLAGAALVGAVVDHGLHGRALPGPHRQVDEDWLARYRGWVYGGGFGVQLGVGVSTIVTTAAVYVTWLAAALTGSAAGGAAVGLVFGLVRALPVLGLRGVRSGPALATTHRRLVAAEPAARTATTAVLAVVGTAALGVLLAGGA